MVGVVAQSFPKKKKLQNEEKFGATKKGRKRGKWVVCC